MTPSQAKQLIINGKKPTLIVRIILFLVLIISFFLPIAATIFAIQYADGFKFGLIISYILCWGIGIYFLRIILWNTYGKEILTLHENLIVYYADYKYFKDGFQEIEVDNLNIEIIEESEDVCSMGRLYLFNEWTETAIETVLKERIEILNQIKNEIKTHYNKV